MLQLFFNLQFSAMSLIIYMIGSMGLNSTIGLGLVMNLMKEQQSAGKIRLAIMLGSALAVGFLLGYLASAFVPLVRPPQSPAASTPATPPGRKLSPSEIDSTLKAAHDSLEAGDLQAAWEKYHQVLIAQYAHALFDKGQALKAKGHAKGATEAFRRFLALVPPDSDDAKRVKGWIAELARPNSLGKETPGPAGEKNANPTSDSR